MFNLAAIPFNKIPVKQGVSLAKAFVVKNHKEILVITGSFGTLVAAVMAVDGGLKADKVIAAAKLERMEDNSEWTRTDTVALAVPYFVPSAIVWALSIAMIIFAIVQFRSENAALAAAYALSEASNEKNIKKLKQLTGFETKEELKADEKITRSPIEESNIKSDESVRCYEPYCGSAFSSSASRIRNAVSKLNFEMSSGDESKSLNDFFWEIGLNQTELGGDYGWNIDDGLIDVRMSAIRKGDDIPYLEVEFVPKPSPMFRR